MEKKAEGMWLCTSRARRTPPTPLTSNPRFHPPFPLPLCLPPPPQILNGSLWVHHITERRGGWYPAVLGPGNVAGKGR